MFTHPRCADHTLSLTTRRVTNPECRAEYRSAAAKSSSSTSSERLGKGQWKKVDWPHSNTVELVSTTPTLVSHNNGLCKPSSRLNVWMTWRTSSTRNIFTLWDLLKSHWTSYMERTLDSGHFNQYLWILWQKCDKETVSTEAWCYCGRYQNLICCQDCSMDPPLAAASLYNSQLCPFSAWHLCAVSLNSKRIKEYSKKKKRKRERVFLSCVERSSYANLLCTNMIRHRTFSVSETSVSSFSRSRWKQHEPQSWIIYLWHRVCAEVPAGGATSSRMSVSQSFSTP